MALAAVLLAATLSTSCSRSTTGPGVAVLDVTVLFTYRANSSRFSPRAIAGGRPGEIVVTSAPDTSIYVFNRAGGGGSPRSLFGGNAPPDSLGSAAWRLTLGAPVELAIRPTPPPSDPGAAAAAFVGFRNGDLVLQCDLTSGRLQRAIGNHTPTVRGNFGYLTDLLVDRSGNLLVSDTHTKSIHRFSPRLEPLPAIPLPLGAATDSSAPMCQMEDGRIVVALPRLRVLVILDAAGHRLSTQAIDPGAEQYLREIVPEDHDTILALTSSLEESSRIYRLGLDGRLLGAWDLRLLGEKPYDLYRDPEEGWVDLTLPQQQRIARVVLLRTLVAP